MRKLFFIRLFAAILLIWLTGAVISWLLFDPSDTLVGVKRGVGEAPPIHSLAVSDLSEAADLLSKTALWGIRRDGSAGPLKDASKGNAEEKKPEWRMLATVVKGQDKYLLIQVDGKKLESVKEGERLPDGSLLKTLSRKMYTILNTDDEEKTTYLNFDEPSNEKSTPERQRTRRRK